MMTRWSLSGEEKKKETCLENVRKFQSYITNNLVLEVTSCISGKNMSSINHFRYNFVISFNHWLIFFIKEALLDDIFSNGLTKIRWEYDENPVHDDSLKKIVSKLIKLIFNDGNEIAAFER